ncbi:unnamed protein product [Amoebophrya sp. A25]|nr:unnamed protein product [Amoebophrya sp. A25]|eukprot:GSA25T00009904001.1
MGRKLSRICLGTVILRFIFWIHPALLATGAGGSSNQYPFFRACPEPYHGRGRGRSLKCYDGTAIGAACSTASGAKLKDDPVLGKQTVNENECCDTLHGGHATCPRERPVLCPAWLENQQTLRPFRQQGSSQSAPFFATPDFAHAFSRCVERPTSKSSACVLEHSSAGSSQVDDAPAGTCESGCTTVYLRPAVSSGGSGSSSSRPTVEVQQLLFRSGPATFSLLPDSCFSPSVGCGLRLCDVRHLEVQFPPASSSLASSRDFNGFRAGVEVRNSSGAVIFTGDVLEKQLSFTGRSEWVQEGRGCCADPPGSHASATETSLSLAGCKELCLAHECDFIEFAPINNNQQAVASMYDDAVGRCRALRGQCRSKTLAACAEESRAMTAASSAFTTHSVQPATRAVSPGARCDETLDSGASSLFAFPACGDTEVCRAGRCHRTCVASKECAAYPYRVCDFFDEERVCSHKKLFADPIDMDILGTLCFFLFAGLALSAGVGGGGIYVPLLILLLRFRPQKATAISQSMLAGGSISVLLYNLKQRHPVERDRPMIDFDLTIILGFPLMAGVQMGAVVHKISPDWLILFVLIVVLTDSGRKTLKKGISLWKAENKSAAEGGVAAGLPVPEIGRKIYEMGRKMSTSTTNTSYQEFDQEHELPESAEVVGRTSRSLRGKEFQRKNSPSEQTMLTSKDHSPIENGVSSQAIFAGAGSPASASTALPSSTMEARGNSVTTVDLVPVSESPIARMSVQTTASLSASKTKSEQHAVVIGQQGSESDLSSGTRTGYPNISAPVILDGNKGSEIMEMEGRGQAVSAESSLELVDFGAHRTDQEEENSVKRQQIILGQLPPARGSTGSPIAPLSPLTVTNNASIAKQKRLLLGVWAMMLAVSAVKTSFGYCTGLFWVILLAATYALLWLAYRHSDSMVLQYQARMAREGDSEGETSKYRDSWEFFDSRKNAVRLLAYAYGAGTVAAMCGIGGGMLLGPIMLEMGLRPQVTTATTATTLFMLSTTASLIFILSGVAPLPYALFFAGVCCAGAIVGKSVINHYVKKYQRTSLIALILAAVIIVSTVMLLLIGLLDLVGDVSAATRGSDAAKADLWFKSLCSTASQH